MTGFIGALIVGVICIFLGASNMRGNISSLHSYHRNRVSEEDRIPFGKRVGLGTIIIGSSIVLLSLLSMATLYTDNKIFNYIGYAVFVVGLIIGLIITFSAMIKYNKGIFN